MKLLTSFNLSLLLTIFCCRVPAQSVGREADSLKFLLHHAGSDTARIRLRSELGIAAGCIRAGYWDSLVADAHSCGSSLYNSRVLSAAARMLMREPHEKKALSYNEQGYAIALENGDRQTMISYFINLGSYYCYVRNNASTALDYCFKGLEMAGQDHDERSRNRLMIVAGTCYFAAGEYKKALGMHLQCLSMALKKGNVYSIVSCLSDVGSDYHGMKDFVKASEYYLECKKYLPLMMDNRMAGEVAASITSGHLSLRQYDSAAKYANIAVSLAKKNKNPRGIASSMLALSGMQYTAGDYAASKKTTREALEIISHLHAPLLNIKLAELLEMACEAMGDHKGALEAYKLFVRSRDSLSSEANHKRLMEMEFNYTLDKRKAENLLLNVELKKQRYFLFTISLLGLFIFVVSWLFYRQSKLRSEHESQRLSHKLLRLQMNPHFIFNSLQAIQGYIVSNDIKESVRYLGAFSLVTRHVLENSRTDHVPLHKEIDLLKNYLQLQQLRFMNRFEYVVQVDESINSSLINIPPMLLQPFIENAVEHGMHDIESGGRIEVGYRIEGSQLVMEITDNGYGLSGKLRHNRSHRSLALEITRERIALMNRREKNKTIFAITDAFPDEAERKGVKVVFRFSLNELQKRF